MAEKESFSSVGLHPMIRKSLLYNTRTFPFLENTFSYMAPNLPPITLNSLVPVLFLEPRKVGFLFFMAGPQGAGDNNHISHGLFFSRSMLLK